MILDRNSIIGNTMIYPVLKVVGMVHTLMFGSPWRPYGLTKGRFSVTEKNKNNKNQKKKKYASLLPIIVHALYIGVTT